MSTPLAIALAVVSINLMAFGLMGLDKSYARHDRFRISEDMLMTMALMSGSIGIWSGMMYFHHKTRKLKFRIGVPLILAIQISVMLWWITRT